MIQLKYCSVAVLLLTHYKNLSRELSCFIQVHSDFVGAATRGAMAVIDGNVMAINPGEDAK